MEVLTSLLKKGKYCITRLKRLKHLSAISKAYQKESLLQDPQWYEDNINYSLSYETGHEC